jgi:hypothetical protein
MQSSKNQEGNIQENKLSEFVTEERKFLGFGGFANVYLVVRKSDGA